MGNSVECLWEHILQQVQNNPYLGLQISDDLKWTAHITNVTKKANSTLGFLRRNLKYCPKDCKKTAYIWISILLSITLDSVERLCIVLDRVFYDVRIDVVIKSFRFDSSPLSAFACKSKQKTSIEMCVRRDIQIIDLEIKLDLYFL
jgi:hypothetical protein